MQLNIQRFEELIEAHAKKRWEKHTDEWELRPSGGERYVQRDILLNMRKPSQELQLNMCLFSFGFK